MAAPERYIEVARIVIGTGAFVANLLTLIILLRIRQFSTHVSLVRHLTFSDMLIGMFGLLLGVLDTYHWVRHQPCSFVFLIVLRSVVTVSMLLVVTMAVEHFMAIFNPWRYKVAFTQRNITLMVSTIWVVSVLFQCARFPQTLYMYFYQPNLPASLVNNTNINQSHPLFCKIYEYSATHQMDYYILFTITCACLGIIIFVYTYIATNARSRMRKPRCHENYALSEHCRRHRKLMKTTFFILVTFVLCWAPVCCILFISSVKGNSSPEMDRQIVIAKTYAFVFPYLNSLCDPIIYGLRMREVRQGYKDIGLSFKVKK